QRKISEYLAFEINGTLVNTNNLFRITNLNAPSPYPLNDPATAVPRSQAAANLTRPVPITTVNGQFQATIGGNSYSGIARDVFMTETKGIGRYKAISMSLAKSKGAT
ncbi:hypothetical protein ABTE58_18570, partial [Acinetobacter baumannii]